MITYLQGDATKPQDKDKDRSKIVAHVCNDIGAWGRGFVLSLTKEYPSAETNYRNWYQMNPGWCNEPELVPFRLGRMKLVRVSNEVFVANMIAQHGIFDKDGVPPIRYEALGDCLAELALHAKALDASIHMPRIGCGLAGGKWSEVEKVINTHLGDLDVSVYDFTAENGDARVIKWCP